ncbi:MAG TPA: serine hydrolase [Candidatus Aminicenantes bacterium]|nr:serine hydrolase [Acidobacteriota bacterium]OQB57158.1 MAG: putative penicillin-binding protein PbpX [Candidatus Aminicenantes bacterium ADurb.Bin147]HNQ79476.1 serine hydrolase [Candidatus Aminicenantes bacterium]HNT32553.1 serine hydrolase [Candidatus Aminicenantes bacterium]HOY98760.1 serine hydrolase [Candidatus Aminicenantes bacterium]
MQRASFKFVLTLLAMILIISAAAVPLPAAVLPSPTPQAEPSAEPTLAGHWEGIIELPGQKLEINIDFVLKEGSWTGDISIPVQKSQDLPLIGIVLDGFKAAFAIQGIPGEPTFKGEISADGKKMTGTFTQGGAKFPFSLELGADPTAKIRAALEGFDQIAEDALKALKVTGAAMAVVKNDKVVYAKGFGYKDVENKIPATPDTIFAIGSSSKAFTVFALGRLVDEGKLEWEAPVRNYIPWFKLYDKEAGARLSVRDLVTHRSGLPRHDLLWYNNKTASREDLVRALAYLPPTADLREKWQYNNLMFLTAGYLLETLTGKPWEDAVRSLVFEPLGMKRSNFSVLDSQKDSDFAFPYNFVDKAYEKLPFRDITNVGPAGSINSSVNEMARWVAVHLADGKFEGRDLLSSSTVSDMHNPHMVTGAVSSSPDIAATAYAMGWFTDVYRGHRRVHHGGNIDGFSAQVAFLPDDGLGFVVLTNMNGTSYPELLVRTATDKILGLEAHDWIGDAVKQLEKAEGAIKKAEEKKITRKVPGTKPAHPLADYAGLYVHPGYGSLAVELAAGRLSFTYNSIKTNLDHWHYETFDGVTIEDPTFKDFKLTFRTDVNGRVASVTGAFEPTIDDIVFAKKPDARQYDPAFLKKLTGRYDLMGQTVVIGLRGDRLTVSIAGQPEYQLEPDLGGEFYLKEVKSVTLRFLTDAKGEVTAAELSQPGGVFEAKKLE